MKRVTHKVERASDRAGRAKGRVWGWAMDQVSRSLWMQLQNVCVCARICACVRLRGDSIGGVFCGMLSRDSADVCSCAGEFSAVGILRSPLLMEPAC